MMGAIRTAVALGALTMSVSVFAQDSRYGWDRSRVERRDDTRGGRSENRSDGRKDSRRDTKGGGRSESRNDNRGSARVETHNWGGTAGLGGQRGGGADGRWDRRSRGDEARVVVRPPVVVDRWDRREGRNDRRYTPYGHQSPYRYGDRDFRQRDLLTITAWFRALPLERLSAYGYNRQGWSGVRYAFRPGLYLSMAVFTRLELLPFDVELELGELPWYLERRIYGNTVLVIDTRTRMVVDLFEIDW
jgi:hypothetical protein